jgi:hypothetical protein
VAAKPTGSRPRAASPKAMAYGSQDRTVAFRPRRTARWPVRLRRRASRVPSKARGSR